MTTMRMHSFPEELFDCFHNVLPSSIDFEDTYDGLGDQLDEANDDFNDDTFGGGSTEPTRPVGKDFDFFGRTANVSDAITEEQLRYNRQQPPPTSATTAQTKKPARTGYEKYGAVSDLQVDPSLWGASAQTRTSAPTSSSHSGHVARVPSTATSAANRKMLSLEEVEAQMRSQAKKPSEAQQIRSQQPQPMTEPAGTYHPSQHGAVRPPESATSRRDLSHQQLPEHLRSFPQLPIGGNAQHAELPTTSIGPQVDAPSMAQNRRSQPQVQGPLNVPQPQPLDPRLHHLGQIQNRQPQPGMSGLPSQNIITHPEQLKYLSEEDRAAFLVEDAKRAKRNHKIFLLSKDNGLMTPQDKNFITRIQLQQLMTATGNTNEQDPDATLLEDFYYQVHSHIRGGPRQNPHQPLNHFAQTYLFQTGGRHGGFNRRFNRGGDNHMQRMEQQVQRAVEAAKLKPKNKQLVIEGSLGKISFSNAKAPKPMLNIKRPESADVINRPQSGARNVSGRKAQPKSSSSDHKSVLRNIEAIYTALMKIEDEARKEPLLPPQDPDPGLIQQHMEWRQGMQTLNEALWNDLKVLEPIESGSEAQHPFIAILSYPKGKKAIPRVFRHLSSEQRVTMLTMIVLHLDVLDVIRLGQLQPGETQLPAAAREAIDLFSVAVTPSLFSYVSEAPLFNVIGLLGLILDRVNVQSIARTRVGLSILTMLTSRATLVREAGGPEEREWQQWSQSYNRLFDVLEPALGAVFPGSVNSGEDTYVWQFLAAIGSGASPEQQQRLVLAVKYARMFQALFERLANVDAGIACWRPSRSRGRYRPKWRAKGWVTSTCSCMLSGWM